MSLLKALKKGSILIGFIMLIMAVTAGLLFVKKFEGFAAYTMPIPTVDGQCVAGYTLVADALDFQMCCVTPDRNRILTVSSDGNSRNGLAFVTGQKIVDGVMQNLHIYDRCVYTTQA
jgi:hypothetical protein